MIADQRRKRLTDAMQESGLDVLLVYGNAWQGDYLRYATDYGILEGEALAIVRRTGETTLYLDSPLEADRAAIESPGVDVVFAPAMLADVEALLERAGNSRCGAAPMLRLRIRLSASSTSPTRSGASTISMPGQSSAARSASSGLST